MNEESRRDLCLPPSNNSFSCLSCGEECTEGIIITRWHNRNPVEWDGNFFCCPACLKESGWLTK